MMAIGSVEFAYSRIASRHGARADEITWHRVETLRDLDAVLDVARTSALARWTRGIGAQSDVHEIESIVRGHWRSEVHEVASWMPPAWQSLVVFTQTWFELALIEHLARHGAALPWMARDALYDRILNGADQAHGKDDLVGVMRALLADSEDLGPRWCALFMERLPRAARDDALLREFVVAVRAHLAAFTGSELASGTPLRRALQLRLERLFRKAIVHPLAAIAYLALVGLDLERLRGELTRRALFEHLRVAA